MANENNFKDLILLRKFIAFSDMNNACFAFGSSHGMLDSLCMILGENETNENYF